MFTFNYFFTMYRVYLKIKMEVEVFFMANIIFYFLFLLLFFNLSNIFCYLDIVMGTISN